LTPRKSEPEASSDQTRRPRLIDVECLQEGAHPQRRAGRHESGQQAQQSASATAPAPSHSGMVSAAERELLRVPRTAETMFAETPLSRPAALTRDPVLAEAGEGAEAARTRRAAPPLQAGECLGDHLDVIVRTHTPILHAT